MKQQPRLEGSLRPLESLPACVVVEAESIVTASFVDVVVFILGFSQKFIIDVNSFSG